MSLAQSYVLASKVRSKLTRDASNPKTALRNLVVQANMLDNLMDHISDENAKRVSKLNQVKFEIPKRTSNLSHEYQTSVLAYEVSDESDSDSDSDFDSGSENEESENEEYDNDEEYDSDDYYYSSEEEEVEEEVEEEPMPAFKLSTIVEEPEVPELSVSSSTDESENEEHSHQEMMRDNQIPRLMNNSLFKQQTQDQYHHQRHNAIYSVGEVF